LRAKLPGRDLGTVPAMRTGFAAVLVIGAAFFLTLASVAFWGNRTVGSADAFGDAVAEALAEPEVSRLVARESVDALIERYPALAPYRGQLIRRSARIVRQERFREAANELGRSAHRVVVESGGGPVVINVDTLYPAVKRAARQVAPDLAGQLPEQSGIGEITLVESGVLPDLSPVSQGFAVAAVILILIALLILLLALALGRDRGVVLAVFGVAVAIGSVIVLLSLGPIAGAVSDAIDDAVIREATRAIAHSLTGALQTQSIVLLIAGLVLTAAGFLVSGYGPFGRPRTARRYDDHPYY
jgi:hypothetical protein